MTCRLTAPNHYLNQCWFCEVHWTGGNFTWDSDLSHQLLKSAWKLLIKNFIWTGIRISQGPMGQTVCWRLVYRLVYREVGSIDDQLTLQRDLDSLENWAHVWGMKFNPRKCTILTSSRSSPLHKFYSLSGTTLQQVSEDKYLGINISKDLHWSKHIQGLTSKVSSTLGLLRRNLSLCPQKLHEQAYIFLIRSRLEHCAVQQSGIRI